MVPDMLAYKAILAILQFLGASGVQRQDLLVSIVVSIAAQGHAPAARLAAAFATRLTHRFIRQALRGARGLAARLRNHAPPWIPFLNLSTDS